MADEAHIDVTRPGDPGDHPAGDGPRAARLGAGLAGAVSLVGGLTLILLNLHGPRPAVDVAVGVVLAAGGLVLLMPHRVRLPTRASWTVAAAAALAGVLAGLVRHEALLGGMYAYVERRGFPYAWLSRGGVADDPATARQLAATDGWQVNVLPLIGDAVVWAYAGLLILVLVRRLRGDR